MNKVDELMALAWELVNNGPNFDGRDKALRAAIEQALNEQYALGAWESVAGPGTPQPQPCVGSDPLCPCVDGDACHYKATPKTKAWPIPAQPEPAGWLDAPYATFRANPNWQWQKGPTTMNASIPVWLHPAPQPEPVALTDAELRDIFRKSADNLTLRAHWPALKSFARAVLAAQAGKEPTERSQPVQAESA